MPPTTKQVLDALEAMQEDCVPIPKGYKGVAKSAHTEIKRLKELLAKAKQEVELVGEIMPVIVMNPPAP